MKFDPSKRYLMPLIMGPTDDLKHRSVYGKVEMVGLQYQTDSDAVQPLLPDCYVSAMEPIVTVWFAYYDDVDFMSGRGYRETCIQVAAKFDGEKDHVEGDYVLVMFLDDTIPIIGGREIQGVPKLYGDISPVKTLSSNHLQCETSMWGNLIFGIDLEPLKKQNRLVRFATSKKLNNRPLLCYKYIPSYNETPDASYPTTFISETKIEQLWLGKTGQIFFGESSEAETITTLLNALKSLPIHQITQTFQYSGSLIIKNDLARKLE
jgi:acetoacetate decarboxylase